MGTELLEGRRVTGPVTNLAAAAAANATAIYTRPTSFVGTTSAVLRKLMVRANAVGGAVWLQVGTGVGGAFANLIPPVRILDNLDSEWQEVELPAVEAFATITAFPTTLPAGSLDVQIEVEERR